MNGRPAWTKSARCFLRGELVHPIIFSTFFRVTKRRPLKLYQRKRRIKPRFFEHKGSEVVVSYSSIYERIVDSSKSLGRSYTFKRAWNKNLRSRNLFQYLIYTIRRIIQVDFMLFFKKDQTDSGKKPYASPNHSTTCQDFIRQLDGISFGNLAGFNPRSSPISRWPQGTSARRRGTSRGLFRPVNHSRQCGVRTKNRRMTFFADWMQVYLDNAYSPVI